MLPTGAKAELEMMMDWRRQLHDQDLPRFWPRRDADRAGASTTTWSFMSSGSTVAVATLPCKQPIIVDYRAPARGRVRQLPLS